MAPDDDVALFARLRWEWQEHDPVPVGLADRMVAAVAVEGVAREYALLTLVEGEYAAVRGDGDTATLQFSDGRTSVLLHVSVRDDGQRRIDGWVDAAAAEVRLVQGDRERVAAPEENGRFAFDGVRGGLCRVRLTVGAAGGVRAFETPQFEV